MPNGDTTSYTYDYLNRLSAKRYGPGGGRICDYHYYQAYENLMSPLVSDISYHQGNQGDRVTSFKYRYDNVGNIERAEQSDSVRGTIAKSTYRYDRFNQLIQEERDGKTWFYQYDTVGNLLWVKTFDKSYDDYEEAASAVSYKPELLLGTDTYTYGDSEWQDLLTAFNGRSITYDAIGNPLTYYNGTDYTMTWEQGRRLTSLRAGGKTVSYRYDSAGKRTGKTVGTGQTEYIYAGGQLVSILGTNPDYRIDLIYDESGVQSCIYTAGTAAPVTYYLIKNAQGDVMQLRDEADTIVANYAYDAFGRLLSVTDIDGKAIPDQTSFAHRNPLRYRGYLYDSETGFYYLSSRYYDPKIRRFINADSQLNLRDGVLGFNVFAYCLNNPPAYADENGTIPTPKYDTFVDNNTGEQVHIGRYHTLRYQLKGQGYEIHHIVEKRFLGIYKELNDIYHSPNNIPCVALRHEAHANVTASFRKFYGYGVIDSSKTFADFKTFIRTEYGGKNDYLLPLLDFLY